MFKVKEKVICIFSCQQKHDFKVAAQYLEDAHHAWTLVRHWGRATAVSRHESAKPVPPPAKISQEILCPAPSLSPPRPHDRSRLDNRESRKQGEKNNKPRVF